jgi:sarcosine oxidase
MPVTYDVIVLGVGGMGSAACLHLARRGVRVLGLEQFPLVHDRGSSHGQTRIIRQAYFEHPDYVPLLFRTYDLWQDLEQSSEQLLFRRIGLVLSGRPDGETIRGAKLSANLHRLAIDTLTSSEAHSLWPTLTFPEDHEIVFESAAGMLFVEQCVQAHIDQAVRSGARIQSDEAVRDWSSDGKTVTVRTDRDEYVARSLVITAGAWSAGCLKDLGIALTVLRKYVGWFAVRHGDFRADSGMPTYFFELPHGTFYGFPSLDGQLVKVAEHSGGQVVKDPHKVQRSRQDGDTDRLAEFIRWHLPGLLPIPSQDSVCLYTLSSDQHFVVDLHPQWRNVVLAAGFSGHGFKFAPVIGEALADLVLTGQSPLPIQFLKLARFHRAQTPPAIQP